MTLDEDDDELKPAPVGHVSGAPRKPWRSSPSVFTPMHLTINPRDPIDCPNCDAEIVGILETGPAAPQPGGFTICWQCKEELRFSKRLQLRRLTDADRRTLDLSPATRAQLNQLRIQIAVKIHP